MGRLGDPVYAQAEMICAGRHLRVVAEQFAAAPDDVDLGQRTRHSVETGGEYDRVDIVMRVSRVDTR